MYLIGLTGGIASGKSTVSRMLISLGAVVIDADAAAREIVQPGQPAWKDIIKHFGEDILLPDRTLDRFKLGERIFSYEEEKAWLDGMMHPRIETVVLEKIEAYKNSGVEIAVLDAPLLLEAAWEKHVDEIWVVAADKTVQLARLRWRNRLSEPEARRRIDSQMPLAEKIRRADFVIDNNGAMREMELQVASRWKILKEKTDDSDGSNLHTSQ